MSVPVRPATLGEIVDRATWLYLDQFRAVMVRSGETTAPAEGSVT